MTRIPEFESNKTMRSNSLHFIARISSYTFILFSIRTEYNASIQFFNRLTLLYDSHTYRKPYYTQKHHLNNTFFIQTTLRHMSTGETGEASSTTETTTKQSKSSKKTQKPTTQFEKLFLFASFFVLSLVPVP